MRTLEELNLSDNKIISIEPEIKELLRLKVLNLENNALTDLPAELAEIPFLSTLLLRGNPLNQKFEPLLSVKFGDSLQDVLNGCFEGAALIKSSNNIKKSETPSWLVE